MSSDPPGPPPAIVPQPAFTDDAPVRAEPDVGQELERLSQEVESARHEVDEARKGVARPVPNVVGALNAEQALAMLATSAENWVAFHAAVMHYQDAFIRFTQAWDREQLRANREAQVAAEQRTMTISQSNLEIAKSNLQIAKINQRASWAMVFFTIVIAGATAWQACHSH